MKRARRDKQDVVRPHKTVARIDRGAFDDRQDVPLHAFAADVGPVAAFAARNLVDFIQKNDAARFHAFQSHPRHLLHVDQLLLFFLHQRIPALRPRAYCASWSGCRTAAEHVLDVDAHFFDVRAAAISKVGPRSFTSISTTRSSSLPSRSRSRSFSRVFSFRLGVLRLRRHQQIQQPILRICLRAVRHFVQPLVPHHVDRNIHQVADHGLHVAAHITDFGELARLHLHERRIRQLGQSARQFRLADPRRPDHEDVLRHHLIGHFRRQLLAADPVAQRDGDRALGFRLPDDVLIQFADDFARRQFVEGRRLRRRTVTGR